jgi:hypothetical protein
MVIESYAFGKIVIDGQIYERDVILTCDHVWDGWWREEGHRLSIADLGQAFTTDPEILVVGTGSFGFMRVPDETRKEIERREIELYVLPTRKAWTLYNRFEAEGRRVVAAFHLAC